MSATHRRASGEGTSHSSPNIPEKKRSVKDYAGIGLRGVAMGACDVIPGVSGGTMAFILGIYEELVNSLRAVGRKEFLGALARFRIAEAARAINLPFLVSVLSGILVAIFSLAKLMSWLLDNQPVYTWSFFFGLILASVLVVGKRIPKWTAVLWIAFAAAAAGAYVLTGLVPAQTPDALWFIFLSGFLAICAMILPGISGAFILLILGKYEYILSSISDRNVSVLAVFAAGCGIGLVTFAQILSWLFKRYHDLTVALLTGLMLGSLRKVWPWKETIETITNRHGKLIPVVQDNILPELQGTFFLALGLAVVGFGTVLLLERFAARDIGDHV